MIAPRRRSAQQQRIIHAKKRNVLEFRYRRFDIRKPPGIRSHDWDDRLFDFDDFPKLPLGVVVGFALDHHAVVVDVQHEVA